MGVLAHHWSIQEDVAAFPQMAVEGGDVDEMVGFVNGGLGVIGTPDQAIAQIEELLDTKQRWLQADAVQLFLAFRSAVTALPSAWPFDAFMTAPTSAPMALPSPAQNFSHAPG